ncbi:3-dehydroquinate synthase [Calditrichota bacterium GD2]
MEKIDVKLAHTSYPIFVGSGIWRRFGEALNQFYGGRQIAVITNERVWRLHGDKLENQLPKQAEKAVLFVPDGEQAKSFEELQRLYTELLSRRFERGALIIGFGGGVVGDLAGFVAATFLRGVPFVQYPTTLLAQVDSSIGGKVGINHPLGKNLIGAFKQPLFVFSDAQLLQTLPDEEVRCGLGEVIKYGLSLDKALFEYLEKKLPAALNKDVAVLSYLINQSARIKADIVMQDEKESNLRMVLNFGHTFGHALEADFKFASLKHGEAVILGMKCALQFAVQNGILQREDFERGLRLLNQVPIAFDGKGLDLQRLVQRMTLDKKVKDGKIRLVLIKEIGRHLFYQVEDQRLLKQAFEILTEEK